MKMHSIKSNLLTVRTCLLSLMLAEMLLISMPVVANAYATRLAPAQPVPAQANTMMSGIRGGLTPLPGSQSVVGEMLKSASQNRAKLLWSMYPASVRGRVFGNTDGFMGKSSGGWG